MRTVRIEDVAVDYVHSPQTAQAEAQRVEAVKDKAEELARRPTVSTTIDRLSVRNATLGFVDQSPPEYRLFLANTTLEVRGVSNRSERAPVDMTLSGLFNGSGKTDLTASFLPSQRKPDFEMAVQIEDADMRPMNDLFRHYGNFDVVGGRFSFYSQLTIRDAKIDGYVKPLFRDLNVYDQRQDSDKPIHQQLYEVLVGSISELLEDRHDEVATQASVVGEAAEPELSTLEVVINLFRNAFFDAILPGLDKAIREAGTQDGSAAPQ
jgi:hypothetical protein